MVSMAAYDENTSELGQMIAVAKDLAARLTEDDWRFEKLTGMTQLRAYLEGGPFLDMLLYDVTREEALAYLRQFRGSYREAGLLLLADRETSPMRYMRPDICADALLLRPWSEEQAREVLEELIRAYMESTQDKEGADRFYVIDTKEGSIRLPYDQIYYFEAREKKIYVCSGNEEFGFYCTIDKLVKELPEQFVRCHRGFIVNSIKIRKVALPQNLLYLTDDFEVPVSRSYRAEVKRFCR